MFKFKDNTILAFGCFNLKTLISAFKDPYWSNPSFDYMGSWKLYFSSRVITLRWMSATASYQPIVLTVVSILWGMKIKQIHTCLPSCVCVCVSVVEDMRTALHRLESRVAVLEKTPKTPAPAAVPCARVGHTKLKIAFILCYLLFH